MQERRIGIVMNGVTGRMGAVQHLARSIVAIRDQGGVSLPDGTRLQPDPMLVGRDERKVRALADRYHLARWSTDLAACLADPADTIYFDAQITALRAPAVRAAIAAGKHVYCEKPTAPDLATALELARLADQAGVRHGVVQDKLFLPGVRMLKRLVESGFFGRILAVRGEFGYWVFEGDLDTPQRPSWNYRAEAGGGIIVDMLPHWRYLLDEIIAPVRALSCLGATHVPQRVDERGEPYACTADDSAYLTFELEGGIVAQINSSWCTRVNRDDLFILQVDGTQGSAVAGLQSCRIQPRAATPRAVWNPDVPDPTPFRQQWLDLPETSPAGNAFKVQWELFLRHVGAGTPFPWTLQAGARGAQLAELGLRSWRERRWLEVPPLMINSESLHDLDGASAAR